MLRAEKLGGVSDQIGVPNPSSGLLSAVLYEMLIAVLLSLLVGAALIVILNFYHLVADLPNVLVAATVLTLEGLILWKLRLRLWAGWKNMLADWYAAAMNSRDDWQGDSLWTQRRSFGRGGRSAGIGIFFGILVFMPAFYWVLGWLPTDLYLSNLAILSVLFAVLLSILLLPELLAGGVGGLEVARQRKRQTLMQRLDPGDWVCPNCLYAEKAVEAS